MAPIYSREDELRKAHLEELGEQTELLLHDIKNALSVVLLGLSTLEKEKLSGRNIFRVELALEEALRMQYLVSQPIAYARRPRSFRKFQSTIDRLEVSTDFQSEQSAYLYQQSLHRPT